jgi:leucyl-tRNA synthetase
MSWDLFVQDWGNFESLDDISNDFEPQSIGKRSEVIDNIKAAEPTIDFSNPSWGILENEQFTIEFNMGNSEECDGFVMHIRGNELALPCVGNILDRLKLRAADGSSPFFFDIEKSKGDLQKWIDYRDSILNR